MVTLNCANTAEQALSKIRRTKQNCECYSEEESREYTTAGKRLDKRTMEWRGGGEEWTTYLECVRCNCHMITTKTDCWHNMRWLDLPQFTHTTYWSVQMKGLEPESSNDFTKSVFLSHWIIRHHQAHLKSTKTVALTFWSQTEIPTWVLIRNGLQYYSY